VDTETPDWLAQLQASEPTPAEAETGEEAGSDLRLGAAAAGLAGAGAALFVAHEAGEEKAEPAPELEQPMKPAEELPVPEEEPDWIVQLRETPPAPFSEQIPTAADTETPDWLAQLQASEPTPESQAVVGEEPDWIAQLRGSSAEAEINEEAGPDLHLGAVAAGLAGAALFVAHEAGEEKTEPTPEPEQPIDVAQPSASLVAETEQPPSFGVTAAAVEPEVPEEMPSADDALAFLAAQA
jgi:hypothetical protein